jgi:hypothetical protein
MLRTLVASTGDARWPHCDVPPLHRTERLSAKFVGRTWLGGAGEVVVRERRLKAPRVEPDSARIADPTEFDRVAQ